MGDLTAAQQLYGILGAKEEALGKPALQGATDYLTNLYNMGGTDQTAKYRAMGTDVAEAALRQGGGGFGTSMLGMEGMVSGRGQQLAIGESGVGTQKVLAGVDEINKIRSMLGTQGLRTTALGTESAQQSVQALSMEPVGATQSAIFAGLGGASAIYGALNKPNTGTGQTGLQSPSQFSSQFTLPAGSDQSYFASGPGLNLQPTQYGGGG